MNSTPDDLLTRKETAALCKISDRTLDRQNDLPRVQPTVRRIMYRRSDVVAWIATKTAPRANAPMNDRAAQPADAA